MAKRTARDFTRKQIWEIASLYASTESIYSSEYFSHNHEISQNTFYKLIEKAVIEGVVDDRTVANIAAKAAFNSFRKAGEKGENRTKKHYDKLNSKRKEYILPKEKAVEIVTKYANSNYSKEQFAIKNYITKELFSRTIYKAITENWISDEVVEKLKKKSITRYTEELVLDFWKNLIDVRNENKQNQS